MFFDLRETPDNRKNFFVNHFCAKSFLGCISFYFSKISKVTRKTYTRSKVYVEQILDFFPRGLWWLLE